MGTDTDVGLLIESHRDTRGPDAPATLFNHDIFVGTRIALNDTQDTEFLAGAIFDTRYSGVQSAAHRPFSH